MNVKSIRQVQNVTVNLDKERHLRFDLNAFAALEESFGSIDAAMTAMEKGSIKAIRAMLWAALIHEDETLTEKQVGSMLQFSDLLKLTDIITNAISDATPDKESVENIKKETGTTGPS